MSLLSLPAVAFTLGCGGPSGSAVVQTAQSEIETDGQRVAVTPTGAVIVLEVARDPDDRALGLMFRESVPRGTGMLFEFDRSAQHSFWMLNCEIPLDIAWLDDSLQVVHLFENAPPCPERPCPSYAPPVAAHYVVEVAGGEARPAGIVPGARLLLQPLSRAGHE